MSFLHNISHKEKTSTAYKEKLLKDLAYYDRRLKEFRNVNNTPNESYDSSDSDNDLPICKPLDATQDIIHLKNERESITTCLNATQELTGLTVLESEISILSEDPVFADKLALEPGLWKEVLAECRVDMVPISISFYLHQPHRKFAPPSFHALRVALVKAAHETELNASILNTARTPSEVIEVIKNYSAASRSRKTTLAKLAEAFSTLYMEPMDGGGYKLKCADLIEICWRLENNVSTVSPFRHKLKFDLEYLDECHLRPIKEAYKELSYPKLDTDERTLLLAKIIKICLKAKPIEGITTTQEAPEVNNLMEVNMAEIGAQQAEVNKMKKSAENQTQNIKEAGENIEQKKKKQKQKIFKENHDPNSKEVVQNKQKSVKSKKNQKATIEVQQNTTDELNDAQNEEYVMNQEQKKSDVIEKELVNVENNIHKPKANTKSITKKSSEIQKTGDERSEVNIDKATDNTNTMRKNLPKISKEVSSTKMKLPTKVQKEKDLKGKAENTNRDGDVKITNEMQKQDLPKTPKEVTSNKDSSTKVQKENGLKKKATNNNIHKGIKITNQMKKKDSPKTSEEVTAQKDVLSTEVQKEKALKRKAEYTNKQTEVKKSKKSSQVTKNDEITATSQISKQPNKGIQNKTCHTNLKNTKNNTKEVKTVTKSQSETDNQKALVKQYDEIPRIEKHLESVSSQAGTFGTNTENDKNTDNLENNQLKNNIEKNNHAKFIALTNEKQSTGAKNKLKGTKTSNTQMKAGNINKKIPKPQSNKKLNKLYNQEINKAGNSEPSTSGVASTNNNLDNPKTQSTEQVNKPNNLKINRAGNPEPTGSGVANTNKVNLDKPKETLNSRNNGISQITNKIEKNQLSKNTNPKKTAKHVASNKNLTITKTLFKDRTTNSKGHAKDRFKKTLTNKTHANINLASKLNKINPSNIVQNDGTTRIPQKKMSPGLKNAMKNQVRKSPRNLTKMMKKPEKLVSNIPRIIKALKPH